MDKRQLQIKERKKKVKNIINREQNKNYKVLIFCMVVGALNWVFWHDQFVGLDVKYDIVFVILPFFLGLFVYFKTNNNFIKAIFNTKSSGLKDTILSYGLLLVTGIFFSYISFVTLANVVFKIGMDLSTNNKPIIIKFYSIESTYRNDRGRGIHLFSSIYYLDEENKTKNFKVKVDEVKTSYEKRKIVFLSVVKKNSQQNKWKCPLHNGFYQEKNW